MNGEWLCIRNIVADNKCSYKKCDGEHVDTLQHYLISCKPVLNFWQSFINWWNRLEIVQIYPLEEENILLGFPYSDSEYIILNFCLILAKYHIYQSKRNNRNMSFLQFLILVKEKLTIEEHVYINSSRETEFINFWGKLYSQL